MCGNHLNILKISPKLSDVKEIRTNLEKRINKKQTKHVKMVEV